MFPDRGYEIGSYREDYRGGRLGRRWSARGEARAGKSGKGGRERADEDAGEGAEKHAARAARDGLRARWLALRV